MNIEKNKFDRFCSTWNKYNDPDIYANGGGGVGSLEELIGVSGVIGDDGVLVTNATKIRDDCFTSYSIPLTLTEVYGENVETIGNGAFGYNSALTTADFPACVSIGEQAFRKCTNLTDTNFPNCTTISSSAFEQCASLELVSFPTCTTVKENAFAKCSALTAVSLPHCTSIGYSAFEGCTSLSTVHIPSCSSVASSMFYNCATLSALDLPNCSCIFKSAFYGCVKLLDLHLESTTIVVLSDRSAFMSTPIAQYTSETGGIVGSIYVPAALYNSYKVATNWSVYSSRFVSIPS